MKKVALLCFVSVILFACKKEHEGEYKVKYTLTGTNVEQFKAGINLTEHVMVTPFTGTKDTTVYVPAGTVVKLDAKASGAPLSGAIYVDGDLVASQTDSDTDGDGKTAIKFEYTVSNK